MDAPWSPLVSADIILPSRAITPTVPPPAGPGMLECLLAGYILDNIAGTATAGTAAARTAAAGTAAAGTTAAGTAAAAAAPAAAPAAAAGKSASG